MKRVVSVSLGSSRRDHSVKTTILGQEFSIERRGTDGDKKKAIQLIRELDGVVDAIGLGGINLYLVAGNRRLVIRDAVKLAEAATRTPVVDGTGLKLTLEKRVIQHLESQGIITFKDRVALVVVGVDRFSMAEAMVAAGARVILGDLMFALGLPFPLRSLRALDLAAMLLGPVASRLPIDFLYPTGKKQDDSRSQPRFGRYYREADIIAGDYHFVKSHMPRDMKGKIIITNTVTSDDVEDLRTRGVKILVTTTPEMNGRSFGTNVIEGVLVALAGKGLESLGSDDYCRLLDQIGFQPRVLSLNS